MFSTLETLTLNHGYQDLLQEWHLCFQRKTLTQQGRQPLNVCVYVCMYVCMHVCMYVYIYILVWYGMVWYRIVWYGMYVCMHAWMDGCRYVRTYVRMYVCMYISKYIYIYIMVIYIHKSIMCVCGWNICTDEKLLLGRWMFLIWTRSAGGMAAVSLAMPTKLWDSAGRECGR